MPAKTIRYHGRTYNLRIDRIVSIGDLAALSRLAYTENALESALACQRDQVLDMARQGQGVTVCDPKIARQIARLQGQVKEYRVTLVGVLA